MKCEPLEPRRLRHPRGAYGWTDLKVVTDGHLERMGTPAALTYLFLCAVGNVYGVSFWSHSRMARILGLAPAAVRAAIERLVDADLIAARDHVVQVLPVPDQVKARTPGRPPLAGRLPLEAIPEPTVEESDILEHEPEARAQLSRFLGRQPPSSSAVRGLAKALAMKAKSVASRAPREQTAVEVTPRG